MVDSLPAEAMKNDRDSFGLQVAGGAHHLNNIFAQVLLNAELLDRSRLDDVANGMLDSIVEGVHAAIGVVDALAAQSTREHGELTAVSLKYLVKGFQKRRDALFGDNVVINAQYPPKLRLAWARPPALFGSVMKLCRMTVETSPERHTLFIQVEEAELSDGTDGVAIDVAAPAPLVEAGLRAGSLPTAPELAEIVKEAEASGGEVSIVESATGGTLIRFLYPVPPED